MAAIAGRPSRFPFSRAWARPAQGAFPQDLSFELGEYSEQAGHRSTGWCGQIQRFGQGDEPDTKMIQFLKCCQ
jgi:hypothetical protein